jgi:hypothetical protein
MILPAAGRFVVDAEGQVASAVERYVSVSAEHRSSKTHNDKLRTFSPSSGYVFVTNRGFMHAFDNERWTEVGLACGYKIDDFASRTGAQPLPCLRSNGP